MLENKTLIFFARATVAAPSMMEPPTKRRGLLMIGPGLCPVLKIKINLSCTVIVKLMMKIKSIAVHETCRRIKIIKLCQYERAPKRVIDKINKRSCHVTRNRFNSFGTGEDLGKPRHDADCKTTTKTAVRLTGRAGILSEESHDENYAVGGRWGVFSVVSGGLRRSPDRDGDNAVLYSTKPP